jgi:hypothetical protein
MSNSESANLSPDFKPFLIYIRHRDKQRDVSWRPDAFMGFSHGLRLSGLLAALPAEELKSLLYLLSFVTPNGDVMPSAMQLAEAFHLSVGKTNRRMERLMQLNWANEPLVHYRRFESGLDAFVPHAGLFTIEEEAHAPEIPTAPAYRAASREEVIAHSRRMYARPRAEVEEMILRQLRPLNPRVAAPVVAAQETAYMKFSTEQQPVVEALQSLNLTEEQITSLLTRFDLPRIKRQILWLPHRHAKNLAGFLIAAIERDYEPPRGLPVLAESQTPAVSEPDDTIPQKAQPPEFNEQ